MRNALFEVDSVDLWKKGLSREKPVQGYIGLQRVTNPYPFFREKRVYQRVELVDKLIFQL
jgi:hypothetical protein